MLIPQEEEERKFRAPIVKRTPRQKPERRWVRAAPRKKPSRFDLARKAIEGMPTGGGGLRGKAGTAMAQSRQARQARALAGLHTQEAGQAQAGSLARAKHRADLRRQRVGDAADMARQQAQAQSALGLAAQQTKTNRMLQEMAQGATAARDTAKFDQERDMAGLQAAENVEGHRRLMARDYFQRGGDPDQVHTIEQGFMGGVRAVKPPSAFEFTPAEMGEVLDKEGRPAFDIVRPATIFDRGSGIVTPWKNPLDMTPEELEAMRAYQALR